MGCVYCVEQSNVEIVETCGKFKSISDAGCHCLNPCTDSLAGSLSLRLMDIRDKVETKTREGVFLWIGFTVQYRLRTHLPDPAAALREDEIKQTNDEYIKLAFYALTNRDEQLKSFCLAFIRGHVPEYSIDEIYEVRDTLADRMKVALEKEFNVFGFTIHTALITDIEPDPQVKRAMDGINQASRSAKAREEQAEAEKLQLITKATAEAQAKRLSGEGLAKQRKAVVEGLQSSMEYFAHVKGISTKETMMLVLMNQYFDMLKDVSQNSRTASIFVPHAPGAVGDMARQIRDSALASLEDPSAGGIRQRLTSGVGVAH
eukprot:TRINITY_DN36827_c0_g1_i1.p2 TRINITY_DN36827_c0_g1~~TRINITY_DN36827_c0_g1_i1.p2  ORF type:complete len:317 (+),score=118.60 TRINITY_DN36827_c0_g1_i1:99-1049(+)